MGSIVSGMKAYWEGIRLVMEIMGCWKSELHLVDKKQLFVYF